MPKCVSSTAQVTLAVYDLLGRRVAMLVNGVLDAGKHTARFDASELPSGGYIYRLTTPNGEFTKMMMLMK
ncbi:MAG: T9SS type A sorting domain-containing protein [Bacteroidetes bacterium]|nr:T9SS type A sorting domain-containing protein [Bacteroidota bacterium]